jgi:hypothetical protein
MEYEQCVSCYQDIYGSIWRIFSYLSAVTAALLVFGTQYLTPSAAVAASTVPLLIWFLCIYLPMDRYGGLRSDRLAELEGEIRKDYGADVRHFTLLKEKRQFQWRIWRSWRVRYGVYLLVIVLLLVLVVSLLSGARTGFLKKPVAAKFEGKVEITPPLSPPVSGTRTPN